MFQPFHILTDSSHVCIEQLHHYKSSLPVVLGRCPTCSSYLTGPLFMATCCRIMHPPLHSTQLGQGKGIQIFPQTLNNPAFQEVYMSKLFHLRPGGSPDKMIYLVNKKQPPQIFQEGPLPSRILSRRCSTNSLIS